MRDDDKKLYPQNHTFCILQVNHHKLIHKFAISIGL